MMQGLLAFAGWIGVAVLFSIVAIRREWPAAPTVLLVGGITILVLGVWSIWNPNLSLSSVSTQPYHDTYYIDGRGHYAIRIGVIFLILSAATRWIARQGGLWTRQLMGSAVALFFITVGIQFASFFWIVPEMFATYMDTPENVIWINRVLALSSLLAFVALATILLCLLTVVGQVYLRRPK